MQLQGIKIVSRPVYKRPSIKKGGRSTAVGAVNPDDLRPGALSGDAWSATIDMGHASGKNLPYLVSSCFNSSRVSMAIYGISNILFSFKQD